MAGNHVGCCPWSEKSRAFGFPVQEAARRTSATFLRQVLVFPAVVSVFEKQAGPRRLLDVLRMGLVLSNNLDATSSELRAERQMREEAVAAMSQHLKAAFVIHVDLWAARAEAAQQTQQHGRRPPRSMGEAAEPVDVSIGNVRRLLGLLEGDRRLATELLRSKWSSAESLLDAGILSVLIDLLEAETLIPAASNSGEIASQALVCLLLLCLLPYTRRQVLSTTTSIPPGAGIAAPAHARAVRDKIGPQVLLALASHPDLLKLCPEVNYLALRVLGLLVAPWPCLAEALKAPGIGKGTASAAPAEEPAGPGEWQRGPGEPSTSEVTSVWLQVSDPASR